jgi:hypothetical protein
MATTKDRQEQLINAERELRDHDVMALERLRVAGGPTPPAAAGNTPAVAVPRWSPRGRLLGPISGRWAAIGAVAWVVLLRIGIAVEPPPTNPNAVDQLGAWWVVQLGCGLSLVATSILGLRRG